MIYADLESNYICKYDLIMEILDDSIGKYDLDTTCTHG